MKYTKSEMETMFANGYNRGIQEVWDSIKGIVAVVGIIIILCFILL